jgi:hypothetical protein
MRQRTQIQNGKPTETLPEASPQTWSLKGKVPGYCSHCAASELESMRRLGYPVFVTEFNPDSKKPCGWTVYKDPDLIPEQYFKRLGFTKDPKTFKRIGKK